MSIFQGFFYVQLKAILTYVILQNPPNGELVHRIYLGCPFKQGYKKMTHQTRSKRGPDFPPYISCIPRSHLGFSLGFLHLPLWPTHFGEIWQISPLWTLLKLRHTALFSPTPIAPGSHTLSSTPPPPPRKVCATTSANNSAYGLLNLSRYSKSNPNWISIKLNRNQFTDWVRLNKFGNPPKLNSPKRKKKSIEPNQMFDFRAHDLCKTGV